MACFFFIVLAIDKIFIGNCGYADAMTKYLTSKWTVDGCNAHSYRLDADQFPIYAHINTKQTENESHSIKHHQQQQQQKHTYSYNIIKHRSMASILAHHCEISVRWMECTTRYTSSNRCNPQHVAPISTKEVEEKKWKTFLLVMFIRRFICSWGCKINHPIEIFRWNEIMRRITNYEL